MEREKLSAAEHSLVSLYGHVLLVWLQLSLVPLWFVTRENYNIDLICSEASREGEREGGRRNWKLRLCFRTCCPYHQCLASLGSPLTAIWIMRLIDRQLVVCYLSQIRYNQTDRSLKLRAMKCSFSTEWLKLWPLTYLKVIKFLHPKHFCDSLTIAT